MEPRVIAIDDDELFLTAVKSLFDQKQIPLATFTDPLKAIEAIRGAQNTSPFKMAIVDYYMPINGDQVVSEIKKINSEIHTVVLSGDESKGVIKTCIDAGADHFYFKDKGKEIVLRLAEVAAFKMKHGKLSSDESNRNQQKIKTILNLQGRSRSLAKVAREVEQFSTTEESVLITGQSGVGKEEVAKSLHRNSDRRSKPFIALNCGAIPKDIIESELFGHEKGSFTGATSSKTGKFVAAHGGTIFLDEIGEMPIELQVRLLRVLQERVVVPVGGNNPVSVDIRIITATNRDLKKEIKRGNFREDLYYRVNVLPIHVPPLAERPEDIAPIVQAIIDEKNRKAGQEKRITTDAIELLKKYAWPGNVRELSAVIRKAYTLSGSLITNGSFQGQFNEDPGSRLNEISRPEDFPTYEDFSSAVLNHLEKIYLEKAMILADGKRTVAAKLTGLPYTTYIHKRKNLGLTAGQG